MNTTSSAVQMTNREFFRQRESAALCRIPGVWELMSAQGDQRSALEQTYPDAAFALDILSNPFVQERELGSIRMDAYSAILNGEAISVVRFRYDRRMDAYVTRHNWDRSQPGIFREVLEVERKRCYWCCDGGLNQNYHDNDENQTRHGKCLFLA